MIDKLSHIPRARLHAGITYYLLILLALLLPFSQLQQTRFTSIAIILLFVNWLVEGNLKQKFTDIFRSLLFWSFTGLFFLMFVGLLYTENLSMGMEMIIVRLPLLLFPMIIFSSQTLTVKQVDTIFKAFNGSLLLAALYTFRHGFEFLQYEHGIISDTNQLLILQRPYFGLFLGLALYLSVRLAFKANSFQGKWLWMMAALFFLGFLLLLQVKMPILALLLTMPVAGFLYLLFHKHYKAAAISLATLFVALALFLGLHEKSRNTVLAIWHGQLLAQGVQEYDWRHSLDARTQIWNFCFRILKENNTFYIGLGTGDVKDKLKEIYCANGDFWCQMQFNPHNQWIEEIMRLGIAGILLLLLMFIYPFVLSIRKKRLTYSLFLLFMLLCLMTESYLNREAGVLFYALFNTLLAYSMMNDYKDQESSQPLRTHIAK